VTAALLALLLAQELKADFPGGSVEVEKIDGSLLRVRPARHPGRGWDCWWYFKAAGLPAGTLTLDVGGGVWATPDRAVWSIDGRRWTQTAPGVRAEKDRIRYEIEVGAAEAWFAWGPPFVLADAREAVESAARACPDAKPFELCRSRAGRPVPAVRVRGEGVPEAERRRVWVQARQHAWESGGSWVGRGFLEWLASEAAADLRRRSEIVVVPVMDADSVEDGAGGKEQKPQDHNRDWSAAPHWPEVKAAQDGIRAMKAAGRFDLFIDLHNPAAGDREPFFFHAPAELLTPESKSALDRFLAAALDEMQGPLRYKGLRKESGRAYDPKNWERISKNWVQREVPASVAVTLETSWNVPASTADNYREVGRGLARAVDRFLR
jgi:hypothetical protein